MAVLLSPIGNDEQYFTVNGVPLNAGTLQTYAAGTSTPQATFTTSAGSIQNTNPIVLGVDGRAPQEIWLTTNVAYKFVLADSLGNIIWTKDNISGIASQLVLNSYLTGLTLSAAGGSSTMTIAAGQATDSTNIAVMTLGASIAKTTSGWAVGTGNGGLDSGGIANTTWYHFFLITRPDTNVTDILFSTSAVAPTLPTNYTIFRRIGSGKTDGSAQWIAFIQDGDLFQWKAPTLDVGVTNPPLTAATRTMNVPTGVNVIGQFLLQLLSLDNSSGTSVYFSDLATNDVAAVLLAFATFGVLPLSGGSFNCLNAPFQVRTNTSAQIRSRMSFSSANISLTIYTTGWIDRRGRDS